ncbi:MAG TPA: helix-turn-helix transcriptional regulator [Candidatus Aphodovivens avistercoris]|nr:helix-turn-helix transcriptional regulator [Candidatus Aphodovivens avistercoris]
MAGRAAFRDLIPRERSWFVCACASGCALALTLWSWARVASGGISLVDVLFFVAGTIVQVLCLWHMQKRDVVYSDRVISLAVSVYGVLFLVGGFTARGGHLFQGCMFAACLALLAVLHLLPARRVGSAERPVSEFDRSLLRKPLGYLAAYAAGTGFSKGLMLFPFASELVEPVGAGGYAAGLVLSGALMWLLMLYTMPDQGLDKMTRLALLLAVAGAFVLSQTLLMQASSWWAAVAVSLCLIAMGLGIFLFTMLRMSLDLVGVFALSRWMPCGIGALYVGMLALGGVVGWGSSVLLGAGAQVFSVLSAAVLLATVIVYGLSSERVWEARGLRRQMERALCGDEPELRPRWRAACAKIAEECGLTPREREVFELLAKGRNSVSIEKKLVISNHTVKSHTLSIYRKLGVHSAQELIDKVEEAKGDA